jgi:hypothetical protein
MIGAAVLACTSAAFAGDPKAPICTDRPGKSSSTCAAPAGVWQVESGLAAWSLTKDRGSRVTVLTLGETAIKYGVGPRTHVELALAPYIRIRERGGPGASGFGDVTVKVKHELGTTGGLSAALYPFVKLPTARRDIGNGKIEGGLIVPLSWSVSDALSLSSSPELDVIADGDGRGYHLAGATTLSLGLAANEQLSLALELWHGRDWDVDVGHQTSLGTNAALRLSDNLQIDAQLDLGLTRATPDVEVAGGVSVRF